MELEDACVAFLGHLEERVVAAARGDHDDELDVDPSGKFWLGCLASQESVIELGLGERGERLDPCAMGLRVKTKRGAPWAFDVRVAACVWMKEAGGVWRKTDPIDELVSISVADYGDFEFARPQLEKALAGATKRKGLAAEILVEATETADGAAEIAVTLVNVSPASHENFSDTTLYECKIAISGLETTPYLLESLPDSFRYERSVAAYGINGGVEIDLESGDYRSSDIVSVTRGRPEYWDANSDPPDLSFDLLAADPMPSLRSLCGSLSEWIGKEWGDLAIQSRSEANGWTAGMRAEAEKAAEQARAERGRLEAGIDLLEANGDLMRAFRLMNHAMSISAAGKYDGWRPFQAGFLLANLASVTEPEVESGVADIVWFATGGGKTETYLGLVVVAAFHDRITGKESGVTAWSRFPLRMLSLQQTQRFANAMAGAEMVRVREGVGGEPFSTGFLVGQAGTPNRIRSDDEYGGADADDPDMPARYQVLLECPFCREESLEMAFNRRQWTLEHQCKNDACPWDESGLPFYVVDEEIYRFLPTIIVGTLDKVASVSLQAAMRGLVGSPKGECSGPRHGYTYAPRSKNPTGCLVPGCRFEVGPVRQSADRFGPSFRLQDELHLLKDSLGAVDSHYESLLDHLQVAAGGFRPKVLASSATLTGYEKQVAVLYRRDARVFPQPGPSPECGFWSRETDRPARRFVALAPRGVTHEYAVDRTATVLQGVIRELVAEPERVCGDLGIDPCHAPELVSLYGVDVIYGNTLRDLEAVTRSLETQVPVEGELHTATLTGRTDFDEVRRVLDRLEKPEEEFQERLHVISASSMMSHGVDIDRLNAMIMLGLPLSTSEFIQATARVGRRWPGIVFVMHKISRERDAALYRSFEKFVEQGDRFVEPVPITRRSRRVLERTIAGIELARILAIYEFENDKPLTTVSRLREYVRENDLSSEGELDAVIEALGITESLDEYLRADLAVWFDGFFENLLDPGGAFRFPSELAPLGPPMTSLRDVEEQAPILGMVNR